MYVQFKTRRSRSAVLTVAVGAAAVTLALVSALAGLFDSASQMPWLAATHTNAALLKRCHQMTGTLARRNCVAEVVAGVRRREQEPPGIELAGADGREQLAASGATKR